ncbi:CIA30 family protein [Winogradskyella ursingii]|uniref:CIA30 family protein n=1 Tax=Winogradskyella ursingii TaxID=2686079 RepID=UPI001FECC319|nr:CIA30 family protein [Winogradskyella ursingii]
MTIFDFNTESNINNWNIVDDVVMGGKSNGQFELNDQGHAVFSGKISLENNGGFSSIQYGFETIETNSYSKFLIRVKGDGKKYQFRVKNTKDQRHSFIYEFTTTKEWQNIEIPFSEMYPAFRGNRLDIPNYDGEQMAEITYLIGNKKEDRFQLLIDFIKIH